MAFALFFSTMSLISLGKNKVVDSINRGFWLIKFMVMFALICWMFFFGSSTVRAFYVGAVVFSPLAIIWLLVCLIDLSYKAADFIATRVFEHGSKFYGGIMVTTALITWTTICHQIYLMFKESSRMAIPIVFSILIIASLMPVVFKLYHKANINTAGVVGIATSYMSRVGLAGIEESSFSSINKTSQVIFFGILIATGMMFISLVEESNQEYPEEQGQSTNREWQAAPTMDMSIPSPGEITIPAATVPVEESLAIFRRQTLLFHVFMLMMTGLATVLITNWQVDSNADFADLLKIKGRTGGWIQVSCSMVGQSLFIWTMLAPAIFPGRNFD